MITSLLRGLVVGMAVGALSTYLNNLQHGAILGLALFIGITLDDIIQKRRGRKKS